MSRPPVFFSTFMYSACKVAGPGKWEEYKTAQLRDPGASEWPAFRTLDQTLYAFGCELMVDASTYIDRCRCVAAMRFLASDKDVWLTCDDDMFAETAVLARLVDVCRATRGGVALPYLNRDGKSWTFRKVTGPTRWLDLPGGERAPLRSVDCIGMGLVAVHRDLIERLAARAPHFKEKSLPGEVAACPVLFKNGEVDDSGVWMGEDYYFSQLCERDGTPIQVLLDAPCSHAGQWALLDQTGHFVMPDAGAAARLEESIARKAALFGASSCVDTQSQGE